MNQKLLPLLAAALAAATAAFVVPAVSRTDPPTPRAVTPRGPLAEHERAVHEEVVEAVRADPSHGVEILIGTALAAGRDNPFVRVALSDEGSVLMRSLDDDQQARLQVRDEALVAAVAVELRDAGQELRVPEHVLAGLLRALVMVGWHREDIGVPVADEVLAWLVPTLRAALLDPAGGRA